MRLVAWFLATLGLVAAQEYKLVWEDTFDFFDPRKWDHEITSWGGGNNEFQIYTPDSANSYVRDNTLFLKPTLTRDNIDPRTGRPFGDDYLKNGTMDLVAQYGKCTQQDNDGCVRNGRQKMIAPIMSARIRTMERFAFKYGRLEVEAKMPSGDWMWPAIWMLPEDWEYGPWPKSGEIDLVEAIGNRNLTNVDDGKYAGIQKMGSTLHWGPAGDDNRWYLTSGHNTNETYNYADYFHLYRMDWDHNGLRFYIDDREVVRMPDPNINEYTNWTGWWDYGIKKDNNTPWKNNYTNPWVNGTNMAPFDKPFHIICNVAVGGTNGFLPDNSKATNNGGYPKPYNNSDYGSGQSKFWDAREQWLPTWKGEDAALQIKSVRIYQTDSQMPSTQPPPATQPPATCPPINSSNALAFSYVLLLTLISSIWKIIV
ncbi:unnamed protein product [Owenia fusiformis]|uniref:Uncharacterized protein n=1 Tax=Owenia fusiformis TaxID=6347 RepID=A0A8J1TSB8_OWEFU|nr:unnamed protein product [Owenia fusiformis]